MHELLYPLKFNPILKSKIWGGKKLEKLLHKKPGKLSNIGESWEISGFDEEISIVTNGFLKGNSLEELIEIYMGDLVGDKVFEKFEIQFPLLFKFIEAADVLSVQVHPDDRYAQPRHNSYGKTEMWYVIQADKGAELISGFKKDTDKPEYLAALESGKIKDLLNIVEVKEGDVFFIPAGRVHAIGSGIVLAEIQQTSDLTYRIYDWNRKSSDGKSRELHTDLALEVIDFKATKKCKTEYKHVKNQTVNLVECSFFKTNILEFDMEIEKDYITIDSFIIYMCIKGSFKIKYNDNIYENISIGETVLIPAVLKNLVLIPEKETKILEVYLP
jgi:mannose-6-phosphate isomerase